ncbi:MAG TPA: sigma-70 family RNA polymerase sigma factor [Steroidobacteraceae bacterium]|nr:sigma-70 family RNA polymerase sigma factor [Steroidobacteraceae bacterium]
MGQRFEDLFLPHLDAAYSLARFIARDAVAADDIVQESYLRAFRSFDSYRGGDSRSWLLAIVRNCSYDFSKARRVRADEAEADPDQLPDLAQDGPEDAATRNSEIQRVRTVIGRLPEPFQQTLILRELEELSYREIAQVTSVPVGTVMSRLARARQMLAEALGGVQ